MFFHLDSFQIVCQINIVSCNAKKLSLSQSVTCEFAIFQDTPYQVSVKQEILDEIKEADYGDPSAFGNTSFDAASDPDPGGTYAPLPDESQAVFVPKAEPEDVPPDDDPSVAEAGLDEEQYAGEDLLGLPGPSDAQGVSVPQLCF